MRWREEEEKSRERKIREYKSEKSIMYKWTTICCLVPDKKNPTNKFYTKRTRFIFRPDLLEICDLQKSGIKSLPWTHMMLWEEGREDIGF